MLLLIWLAVSIPRLNGPIDLRWDASAYYVLGTALAEGKGYRLLNEPGEIKTVQYPPLVPLIVAVHQWLMGTSDFFEVGWRLRILLFRPFGDLSCWRSMHWPGSYMRQYTRCSSVPVTGLSFYSFFYPSETLYTELSICLGLNSFSCSANVEAISRVCAGGKRRSGRRRISFAHCRNRLQLG